METPFLHAVESILQNGCVIIRINQTLERGMDLTPLRTLIEQCLERGYNRIAISMTEDSFLYSEILASLVTYYKMINGTGGTLWVVQSNEKIVGILEILGLTDMIRVVPSEQALPQE